MNSYNSAQIKIKDGLYIRLYYKNHYFHTPYRLPQRILKGADNPYFSEKHQKLLKAYGADYAEVNEVLRARKSLIDTLILEAESKGVDPIVSVKLHFTKINKEAKKDLHSHSTLLVEQFEKWYERKKVKVNPNKRSSVSEIPQAVLNNLRHFQTDTKKVLLISEIDMAWIQEFSGWCVTPKQRTLKVYRKTDNSEYTTTKTVQLSNSTLKRHLIELKAFFAELLKSNENLSFPITEIKKFYSSLPTRHQKKVEKEIWAYDYLTQAEWQIVKNYTVPIERRKEWHQIFDMYLFCCNTGLRFVDLKNLTSLDVQNGIITLHAQKTITKVARGAVTVALNEMALAILKKHKLTYVADDQPIFGHILPTNQQANIGLRKVLAEIEILKEKKLMINFHLFNDVKTYERKCDILSWHSSRRTFVNLLVRKGASIQQIQSMTGWIDINSIISYMAQIEDDDAAGLGIVDTF